MGTPSGRHVVFVTGAAGYVGCMLCERLLERADVEKVIALDKEPQPESLKGKTKLSWITANTADHDAWYDAVRAMQPTEVIHTAWQIRELYGDRAREWRWNVEGSRQVFAFAHETPSVERLVHFSTASGYGAYETNTFAHHFTEDEPLREEEYIYGIEKIQAERDLRALHEKSVQGGAPVPIVSIVRPAAITGPAGRFARIRFGLQAALAGELKGNLFYRLVSFLTSVIPATRTWVRQFIHEDDVVDIVMLLAFDVRVRHTYEVFNITPPGEPVYREQMGEITGKRVVVIPPWVVRIAFFTLWHLSRGVVPNGPGVWRFYCYPIVMDGTKLTRMYGYRYQFSSRDAFRYTDGRYVKCVPTSRQKPSPQRSF